MRLAGKVAVVTGGAQGIGLSIAGRFAHEGAAVVVADVDEQRGATTVAALRDSGARALLVVTDVSRSDQVARLFARALETFGHVDVLVNNAGLAHGPAVERHFLDTDEVTWDRVIAVNLKGVYLCSQHAARHMVTRRAGRIISISSCGATRAHRHRVAYDATKGAIEAATRAMALDLAPWGIRVNAIAPGAIQVEQRSPVGEEGQFQPGDVIPLARLGTADDVAGAAVYLASDDGDYLTGIVITVDGGLSAQLRSPRVDVRDTVVG